MWSNTLRRNSQTLILRYSQTKQINYLFPTVFATPQLPVSLKPIDQFQWGLLQKVALQMMCTINQKIEFDQLPTHFIGGSRYGPIRPPAHPPPFLTAKLCKISPFFGFIIHSAPSVYKFRYSAPPFYKSWIRHCILLDHIIYAFVYCFEFNYEMSSMQTQLTRDSFSWIKPGWNSQVNLYFVLPPSEQWAVKQLLQMSVTLFHMLWILIKSVSSALVILITSPSISTQDD